MAYHTLGSINYLYAKNHVDTLLVAAWYKTANNYKKANKSFISLLKKIELVLVHFKFTDTEKIYFFNEINEILIQSRIPCWTQKASKGDKSVQVFLNMVVCKNKRRHFSNIFGLEFWKITARCITTSTYSIGIVLVCNYLWCPCPCWDRSLKNFFKLCKPILIRR